MLSQMVIRFDYDGFDLGWVKSTLSQVLLMLGIMIGQTKRA